MSESWASPHAEAAATAVKHLQDADAALRAAYSHPHHVTRLDNVSSQLKNVASVIAHMPEEEDSRADYAARILALHDARNLPSDDKLPDHTVTLLNQELELRAQKASA